MTSDELEDRLIDYAADVLKFCERLAKRPECRHVMGQLLRSSSSPAANYAEARGAESKADFAHKIAIVRKELQECAVWLKILKRAGLADAADLLKETDELCRIMGATIRTLRGKK